MIDPPIISIQSFSHIRLREKVMVVLAIGYLEPVVTHMDRPAVVERLGPLVCQEAQGGLYEASASREPPIVSYELGASIDCVIVGRLLAHEDRINTLNIL